MTRKPLSWFLQLIYFSSFVITFLLCTVIKLFIYADCEEEIITALSVCGFYMFSNNNKKKINTLYLGNTHTLPLNIDLMCSSNFMVSYPS